MSSVDETTAAIPADVHAWLEAFSAAVRARDFTAGRALFASDVVAFGSVECQLIGLDALHGGQWQEVWPRTRDYAVVPVAAGKCDGYSWAAVTWTSSGHAGGKTVPRSGRATFILRRCDGVLRCVHSHHSFDPDPAQRR